MTNFRKKDKLGKKCNLQKKSLKNLQETLGQNYA